MMEGPCADSEEKHEPASDIDTVMADGLKALDPRRPIREADVKELRAHSKAKTPIAKIMKLTKRTEGSLRQKAIKLGIRLGHRR